jgi:SpoVK/Ycf46/Vps4 family AAA+-type ATPase
MQALIEIAVIYALLVAAYGLLRPLLRAALTALTHLRGAMSGSHIRARARDFILALQPERRRLVAERAPLLSLPQPASRPADEAAIRAEVVAMRRALAKEIEARRSRPKTAQQKPATARKAKAKPKAARKPRAPPAKDAGTQDAMAELDAMIGLEDLKARVREIADLAWMECERVRRGLKPTRPAFHMVFTGNPGTGKTVVAKLIGRIFHALGLLESGHLVEANRSTLVGKYIGQTAPKVEAAVAAAKGGVLFIDEAYLLAPEHGGKDFGAEAIGTLIEHMEKARGELIVIAAGYRAPMARFIESNPGLRSRLSAVIDFPDYSTDELFAIFEKICADHDYALSEGGREAARREVTRISETRGETFGNARDMRTLFERCVTRLGGRLRTGGAAEDDDAAFRTIRAADVGEAYAGLEADAVEEQPTRLADEIAFYEAEQAVLRARLKALDGGRDTKSLSTSRRAEARP